ncbi:MAG: GAF domain-containing protein [Ignavibacteriae bacterium]|nr:GAF domain-containing protein [Ignavibacteriota bacterium]
MNVNTEPPNQLNSLPPEGISQRLEAAEEFGKRINMMSELSLKIGAVRTADEVVQLLRSEAHRVMPGECAFVSLLKNDRTQYDVYSICSSDEAMILDQTQFASHEGVAGWVLSNGSSLRVDLNSLPVAPTAVERSMKEKGVKSVLVVPMKTTESTIGAVGFGSVVPNCYEDTDLWLAQLLGTQTALALANTGVLHKMQKRANQIELVNRVARNLTFAVETEALLDSAAQTIRKQFNYFDVMIFLLDHESQELVLAAQAGRYSDFLPTGYRQPVSQGIIGWVASNARHLLVNDVRKDSRYLAYQYQDTSAELAAPIMIDGVVVGVLNLEEARANAFDEADVLVIQTLCDQIGGAIKNARLFEEIKRANDRLLEHDQLKTEFVSIVSHDFRTPLSTIMLAAKSLIREDDPTSSKRYREYLSIIIDQAGKLSKLAEDTLSIAKIESGQLTYQFKIVNVEGVIKDALSMAKITSRHKFEYSVDINASYVRGDQTKLRQVLQNLISNAVKYSPGGGQVRVNVVPLEGDAEQVLFSVTDQGLGIPADQIGRLFQKFSRVDYGKAKDIKGSGLGLWICSEIIKAHGGRIWVESEMGKGSTFRFTVRRGEG